MTVQHGFIGAEPYISTCRGRRFYLNAPVFDIEEISHATGNICRFGGHSKFFYSVAEHQVLVGRIMQRLTGDPFEGAMHDAHEGYLCDLPKPWKAAIADYNTVEQRLEKALRSQFKLPPAITAECKQADWIALAIEAEVLLPSKGADFAFPDNIVGTARMLAASGIGIKCLTPLAAQFEWLDFIAEYR